MEVSGPVFAWAESAGAAGAAGRTASASAAARGACRGMDGFLGMLGGPCFEEGSRWAASSIVPNEMGRMRPLSAPTRSSVLTGRPTRRKTAVETMMKATIAADGRRATAALSVRRKEIEVYAEPTTEVIAAAHITTP